MAWELDDRDKMVIRFLVFCKREKFSKPSSGLQGLKTKFLIKFFLGSSFNSSSYRQMQRYIE